MKIYELFEDAKAPLIERLQALLEAVVTTFDFATNDNTFLLIHGAGDIYLPIPKDAVGNERHIEFAMALFEKKIHRMFETYIPETSIRNINTHTRDDDQVFNVRFDITRKMFRDLFGKAQYGKLSLAPGKEPSIWKM